MFTKLERDLGKIGLDQLPEYESVIRDWLESLNTLDEAGTQRIEALEYRSRDGFWAASHNHGGLDLEYWTDLRTLVGSGNVPEYMQSAVDRCQEEAENFIKEQGLSRDKESDIERIYEIEDAHLEDVAWFGVRCMYEGETNGTHVLKVYVGANVSEYYGAFGSGSVDLYETEIRFKTASGLTRKLKAITKKVETYV